MKERDHPNDDLPALVKFPFALPEHFVERIGYARADPLVGMYWENLGDELTVYDQEYLWTGAHHHAVYQELIHQPPVRGWLAEFLINLGSSDSRETYHLIVDRARNEAFVAPRASARLIVKRGSLPTEEGTSR